MKGSLARVIGTEPADRPHLRSMAAAAWHQSGVIVIWPDELRNDVDRLHVEQIASRLYGKPDNQRKS